MIPETRDDTSLITLEFSTRDFQCVVSEKVVPRRRPGIGNSVHAETIASAAVAVRIFGAVDFHLCRRPRVSKREDLH